MQTELIQARLHESMGDCMCSVPGIRPEGCVPKGDGGRGEDVREWLTCMGRKRQNCYCGGYDDFATFARRGGRRGR